MVTRVVKMLFAKHDGADRHLHEFPRGCAVGTVVHCPECSKRYVATVGTTTRIKWKPEAVLKAKTPLVQETR